MLKRNIQVLFRVNEQEIQALTLNAKKSGITRDAYIRSLINGFVPSEKPPSDYYAMMRELHAIGNNIHQIAARANATGFFMKDEYAKYIGDFREAVSRIQAAVTFPEKM